MVLTPPAPPTGEVEAYFAREPRAVPLYRAVESTILATFPNARVDVQRSQITFRLRHTPGRERTIARERTLAAVWLPPHPVAGRPEMYVVLTFGLRRRVVDPRIVEAVEPYPGRWTHHLLIARPEDMDDQVVGWLREAVLTA